MSTTKYVVSHMDQQMGPFDEQELRAKWSAGEILPIDYIYDEAVQDWVLLAEKFAWAKAEEVSPPPPVKVAEPVKKAAPAPAAAKALPVVKPEEPIVIKSNPSAPVELSEDTTEIRLEQEPAPTPAAPAPVVAAAAPPAKIKLVNGQGEIDLSGLTPGKVELLLREQAAGLSLEAPHRIQVKAAEPAELVMTVANQHVVGQDLELKLQALDKNGNTCFGYADAFVIQIRGPNPRDLNVTTADGIATLKLANTRAEIWTMSVQYAGSKNIVLPETRMLEWMPGPAARLVLDGPHEYVAGVPLKVAVKAVDQFGNVARNFQGTVALEVKAS